MRFSVLAIFIVAVCAAAVSVAQPVTPPAPRTFPEFLATQDIAVIGTVLDAREVRRSEEGTCGVRGLMPLPITETTIKVDHVLSGVCEDTVITVFAEWHGYFDGNPVGTPVVAWGIRSCDDSWRIRGQLGVIRADGSIVSRHGMPLKTGDSTFASVTVNQLIAFDAQLYRMQPVMAFDGATAIALVRRTDRNSWTTDGVVFTVDSLSWVINRSQRVPRTLVFPLTPGCFPDIYPGDSLLVPVPLGFSGDTLHVSQCPSALRVHCGFAPGLGVRVIDIQAPFARVGSSYHVLRVMAKKVR